MQENSSPSALHARIVSHIPSCPILELELESQPYDDGEDSTCPPRLFVDTVKDMREWTVFLCEMEPLWNGYSRHFQAVGITLCQTQGSAWLLPEFTVAASSPYALRCLHDGQSHPLRFYEMSRFACGRDLREQDVIFKLVDKGTMEDQIYRYLGSCPALYDAATFPCVLPPTAIISSPYKFAFVAMPRWGPIYRIREFSSVREIITYMRCTLTGLSFLHDHRIAHRDIHESNIMMNWYGSEDPDECAERRRAHYRSPSAVYALLDFDLSLQLPLEASLRDCRRPAPEALIGKSDYHPFDIHQGERHYNPFAFDVACLGNLFVYYFADAVSVVPLLAVLFVRMTTHVIDDRFTAAEALAFFRSIEAALPPGVLDSAITLKPEYGLLDDPGPYWSRLPPSAQVKWQSHRPPPLTWSTRVLRRLNTTRLGWKIIPFVRRSLCI
ncbi:hypothetical protein GY45DRAFT_1274204 [Cubamyces sp. BRFM 1775]|nr:hypothetical protein GY45DRAFT_1274204 [Cubamyces sp. BRFM 1775]